MTHHDETPLSHDPDDVAKVRDIIESTDIAMLTTIDSGDAGGRLTSRPLSTQVAEDDGDVLFLVRRSSSVVADVRADPRVNVAYASSKAWVSVAGTAEVVEDRATVQRLWSLGASAFLDGGAENPDNVVVKVHGDTAQLWGGKSRLGAAVGMVKAVTGLGKGEGATIVDLPDS